MLELDHVFCFVEPVLSEAGYLTEDGYVLTPVRRHAGQGTANRSVLFARNYLELIYLADRAEAEANPVRLDRHADHRQSGFSPFGVGLRGELSAEDRPRFWDYRPPDWDGDVVVPVCSCQQRGATVVLVIPGAAPPSTWPGATHLLQHRRATTGIERVRVEGPDLEWPLSSALPSIELSRADAFHMTVYLEGHAHGPGTRLGPLLTIV